MCGIVSVFGSIGTREKDRLLELLDVGKIRGQDATGLAAVGYGSTPSVKVVKRNLHGSDFIEYMNEQIKTALNGELSGIIGHNRLATMGENTNENAHPFTFGNITGVHNGVLRLSSLKDLPTPSDHPVDSGRLFNSISASGVDDTLKSLQGDWALIWYDKAVNKYYFIRNARRPLYYSFSGSGRVLWVMSESDMGEWILSRSGMSLHKDGWKPFKADILYSLDASKREPLTLVEERTIKGKEYTYTSNHSFTSRHSSSIYYLPWDEPISYPPSQEKTREIGPSILPMLAGVKNIKDIPIFSFDELKEMDLSTLEELRDRIVAAKDTTTTHNALSYIELANNNWSGYVTWRGAHKKKVLSLVCEIDNNIINLKRLTTYLGIVKGRITAKKLVTQSKPVEQYVFKPPTKSKSYIELWSDVMARVVNPKTMANMGVHSLYTVPSSNEEEWMKAHADALDEHQQAFIGAGNILSFDPDLEGRVCISWTKGQDVNDKAHREMCQKIHRMLDYFVGPRLKLWDKFGKRLNYHNNFMKAVEIKSYGMDWRAPSSVWMKNRVSIKHLHHKVREAVQFTLDGGYKNPAEIAEVLYKLDPSIQAAA